MDGEAVRRIIEVAAENQARKTRIINAPHEPADVYYLLDDSGIAERCVAKPSPISVTVRSTTALLQLAGQAYQLPMTAVETDPSKGLTTIAEQVGSAIPQIFYSDARCELVITEADDSGRTLRHTLPLPKHPVFSKLEGLLTTRKFTQRELIKFLRAELNANVEPSTIERFRNLKLSAVGEGSSVVEQGRNSVSRSLQQAIKSERGEVIPDEIEVKTPVYDLDELRTQRLSVTVLVDCLPDEHGTPTFELTTVYSSLQAANYEALKSVAFELQKGVFPVIYGQVQ